MPGEPSSKDPRNLWQNQTTESFTMSLDLIRYKVQQREKKSRAETILSLGIAVFLCGVFVWGSIRAQEAIPRVGWALLSFWPVYFAWQTYQWIWPRRLWSDATLRSSLTFYRSELERRRDYTRQVWRRSGLIFCFLGLGMVIVPALLRSSDPFGLVGKAIPFLSLLIVWAVSFLYQRRRSLRELEQEIDELLAVEQQNPS
jgi:hypothetical protein